MNTDTRLERHNRGLTLVELLVVVAVLGIIAAIAIPRLLGAHRATERGAAVSVLRTVASARAAAGHTDMTLQNLAAEHFLDGRFADPAATHDGYTLSDAANYAVVAAPVGGHGTYYALMTDGTIHVADDAAPTATDPALGS